MRRAFWMFLIVAAALGAGAQRSSAAEGTSTPMPGGAYQLSGLSGTMSSTLFNGKIRIKKMSFRTATPQELILTAGQTGVVFSCIVSNGTNERRSGYLGASLVDSDGIVVDSYGGPMESLYGLEPGAAARQSFRFLLNDGFKPVKLVLIELGNGPQPVFRIALKPSDLP
ncbi:MAG TPA: hypothetical protein VKT51_12780 [Candidatus Eremiobacteraceae bacterium]|nr:hypothetical protein [Candidatus Eremiobacteraceae bacterium]